MGWKVPPNWQIKKLLKQTCTILKVTETQVDDEYGQTEESTISHSIIGEIQPITSEDLSFLPPGVLNVGDAIGFFKEIFITEDCIQDFTVESNYSFGDPANIEITEGKVKLKNQGSEASPVYISDNVYPKASCPFTSAPYSFNVIEEKPTGTEIKYIISSDNGVTWYWYDGSWKVSNGTYSEAITSDIISANISTFPFSSGDWLFKAFLYSSTSTNTPELDYLKVSFGFKVAADDYIIDNFGTKYRVEKVTDYQQNNKIVLLECYLKKVTGV